MTRYFPASKVSLFDSNNTGNEAPCEREPVYKYWVRQSWWCVNDHTGCLFNNGHNTCAHLGDSLSPLEEQSND